MSSQRRSTTRRRARRLAGLFGLVLVALLLPHTQSADAVDLHLFDDPAVTKSLDDLPRIDLHPPDLAPTLHILTTDTYGTGEPQVEKELTAATTAEAAALESDQLATDSDGQSAVDRCAAGAFRSVADDYKKALLSNLLNPSEPSWPNFEDDFDSAISACLEAAFPEAPTYVITAGSHYVAEQAAGYATNALGADSAAAVFARWMDVTAGSADAAAEAAGNTNTSAPPENTNTSEPSPPPEDSSSSSPAIPIIVGVVAVAFIGFLVSRSKRNP